MNPEDKSFVNKCLSLNLIKSPCLELGAGIGENSRPLIEAAGLEYVGTDIVESPEVSFIANFESADEVARAAGNRRFQSAVLLNIIEHTFDPIRVLDNVFSLIEVNGTCVITAPVIWPLHDFPKDYWRINPHFYEEYAKRRGYTLSEPFEFLEECAVRSTKGIDSNYAYPPPTNSKARLLRSKIVHKLFDTTGRGVMFKPHVSLGVVLIKAR